MPKKSAPTRRSKPQRTKSVAVSTPFEKIDMLGVKEEKKIEKKVESITVRAKKLLTDHSSLTKAEFVKFFVIPFLISFLLLFVSLLLLSAKDPIHVPSLQVKTSIHSFGDVINKVAKIGHPASLKGQEIFDPYQVKLDIDKGDMFYALIDVRSPEEFSQGHIRDAINLPAYQSFADLKKLTLSEGDVMKHLKSIISRKKPIVIYGTTRDSQLTHDMAAILSRNGYEVSTLGVGWNEWRHFTNLWVPEAGWDSFQIENYVDEK
jgi:rhodanese-related sulfurtransferase